MDQYEEYVNDDFDDGIIMEDYPFHENALLNDKQKTVFSIDILEKAYRFIFAEDLVSYIASEFHGLVYTSKIKNNSNILSNPLNEVITQAINFIRWQIDNTNCRSFEIIRKLSDSCKKYYESFVDAILDHYSENGLKAGTFLYFCVYFAELASRCYRPDFVEILDFSVYAILDAFCMFGGGRYELNNFAKAIVCKSKDACLYPEYKPSMGTNVGDLAAQDPTHKDVCFRKYFSSLRAAVDEPLTTSEQVMMKSNECDIIQCLEFSLNNDMELLMKYLGSDVKDDFSLINKNSVTSFIDEEAYLTKWNENSSASKLEILEDLVEEIMFVVSFESKLFSDIYSSHKTQLNSHSLEESYFENEQEKFVSTPLENVLNIETRNSDFTSEKLPSHNFLDDEADASMQLLSNKIFMQQENKMKFDYAVDVLEDMKVKNAKSKEPELVQEEMASQSDKNSSIHCMKKIKLENDNQTIDNSPNCKEQQIVEFLVVYKREGEASEKNFTFLKADSVLFAEDLVRYIAREFYDISYVEAMFGEVRDLLRNAFNETVKKSMHFIHEESKYVNDMVFDLIASVTDHNLDCYRKYVTAVISRYAQDGLNSDSFLYYCLHFSELASKLYTPNLPKVLDFAVYSILDAFCFLKDDWDEFDVKIQNILTSFKNRTYSQCHSYDTYCYVADFEKECLDNIFGSLKEITRYRT